jgi:hypothetical protein
MISFHPPQAGFRKNHEGHGDPGHQVTKKSARAASATDRNLAEYGSFAWFDAALPGPYKFV